jgi:hypothetical protein
LKEKTPYKLLNGRKPNIAYFWVFGCKFYILRIDTRLSKFDKKCDEGFLLGYSTISKTYRVWNLASGTLEEVHDVEFDETKGHQDENENLEDVRGIQLSNAMKNMGIGELRPRHVNDEEDDQMQVLTNSNVQDDTPSIHLSGSCNQKKFSKSQSCLSLGTSSCSSHEMRPPRMRCGNRCGVVSHRFKCPCSVPSH